MGILERILGRMHVEGATAGFGFIAQENQPLLTPYNLPVCWMLFNQLPGGSSHES